MTPVEAAQVLVDEGFTGWQVVTFGAIGMAESRLDPLVIHRVIKPGSPAHLSIDHGWLQNNDWHARWIMRVTLDPDVPWSTQLADPHINARIARIIFIGAGGAPKGYERWNTYLPGPNGEPPAYKPFLPAARIAARTIGVNV